MRFLRFKHIQLDDFFAFNSQWLFWCGILLFVWKCYMLLLLSFVVVGDVSIYFLRHFVSVSPSKRLVSISVEIKLAKVYSTV